MAPPLAGAIRRRPLLAYFIAAYAITWLGVLPLFLQAIGVVSRPVPQGLHVLGALGPVGGAILVTAVTAGKSGLAEFRSRLLRWRVGATPWLLAVLTPVLFGLVALGVLLAGGDRSVGVDALGTAFGHPEWVMAQFLAALAYGVGEEPGWRGFALPRLQHGRSAIGATLLLAVFWAAWHTPMLFYRFQLGSLMGHVGFFVTLATGAIWLTFLYNSARGSVLVPIVWHVLWNAVSLVGGAISPNVPAVASGLVMVAAGVALVVGRPGRLSLRDKHTLASPLAAAPA